jgi:hypothetical protein
MRPLGALSPYSAGGEPDLKGRSSRDPQRSAPIRGRVAIDGKRLHEGPQLELGWPFTDRRPLIGGGGKATFGRVDATSDWIEER